MSGNAKEHAAEIDVKLRAIRKQVAAFACGYSEEFKSSPGKVAEAKQFLENNREDLTLIQDEMADFDKQTEELDQLLQEADENADKIYASLSQYYAALGLAMPAIDEDALPVGINFEKMALRKEQENSPTSASFNDSSSQELLTSDDSIGTTEEEFGSKVFISRPTAEVGDGAVACTPMIKARKKYS